MSTSQIRADFDRLASFDTERRSESLPYHDFLLANLPETRDAALEAGCGSGALARALAERFRHVDAIDLSPEMLRLARERSQGFENLEFREAELLSCELPREAYDCIATIATLHHLPLEPMLVKLAAALRPGGALLVLDLYAPSTPREWALSAVASVLNPLLRMWRTGRPLESAAARRAWAEHGRRDRYSTLSEVRESARRVLPGARVRLHLFWRYSLLWRKPG